MFLGYKKHMLNISVLIDNDSCSNSLEAEHGLSLFIDDNNVKILFDTGKKGALIHNAVFMRIDLLKLDYIVLSHGHYDHIGGIPALIKLYQEHGIKQYPTIICHPDAFCKRMKNKSLNGSPLSEREIREKFPLYVSKSPYWINEFVVFLGEVPRNKDIDTENCFGEIYRDDGLVEKDKILDDSGLVYKTSSGLVILTGCSHSGVCNIVEYAKKVCSEDRVLDVIGGFHLMDADSSTLKRVNQYMTHSNVSALHACHCTKDGRRALSRQENIGVGTKLSYKVSV